MSALRSSFLALCYSPLALRQKEAAQLCRLLKNSPQRSDRVVQRFSAACNVFMFVISSRLQPVRHLHFSA
jgi:hypothetical protein